MSEGHCSDGQYAGTVGRSMRHVQKAITPDDAVAYAVDEVITGGELNLECVLPHVTRTAQLVELVVYEHADSGTPIKLPIRLVVLRTSQSPADHSTYAAPATITDIVGTIEIEAGDWVQVDGSHAIARVQPDLSLAADGTTLWVVPVAQGAGTFAASAAITFDLRIQFD